MSDVQDHISTIVEDMETLAEDARDLIDLVFNTIGEPGIGCSASLPRTIVARRYSCFSLAACSKDAVDWCCGTAVYLLMHGAVLGGGLRVVSAAAAAAAAAAAVAVHVLLLLLLLLLPCMCCCCCCYWCCCC
jgi:hypothetical protein